MFFFFYNLTIQLLSPFVFSFLAFLFPQVGPEKDATVQKHRKHPVSPFPHDVPQVSVRLRVLMGAVCIQIMSTLVCLFSQQPGLVVLWDSEDGRDAGGGQRHRSSAADPVHPRLLQLQQ